MNEIFSTAHLMGGLGNQMFQVANAYAQSLDGNVKCYFKPFSHTPLQGRTTNHYTSNIFRKLFFRNELPNVKRYHEPDWSYNDKKFDWKDSIEFYGYYQSSKNFLGYDDKIVSLFSPDSKTISFLQQKYPEIMLDNTVSIHIRLGDYKKFPNIHPTISISYINESLNNLPQSNHIFVFSDEKNWIYNNLKFNNFTIVDEEDYIELWLMSLCKNNILSNSSFSWWGSFLNKNVDKKIIAPSIWFGPNGPKNYSDIYQSEWSIINLEYKNGELIYVT